MYGLLDHVWANSATPAMAMSLSVGTVRDPSVYVEISSYHRRLNSICSRNPKFEAFPSSCNASGAPRMPREVDCCL